MKSTALIAAFALIQSTTASPVPQEQTPDNSTTPLANSTDNSTVSLTNSTTPLANSTANSTATPLANSTTPLKQTMVNVCEYKERTTSTWQCMKPDGNQLVITSIWWGHDEPSATWACNDWNKDACKGNCTALRSQSYNCIANAKNTVQNGFRLGKVSVWWGYNQGAGDYACNSWVSQCAGGTCDAVLAQCSSDTLGSGSIQAGFSLESQNGRYSAKMQLDGNFCIFKDQTKVWETGTHDSASKAVLKADGNFVISRADGSESFSTKKENIAVPARLVMQNDGNLVLYDANQLLVWQSGSAGK